MKSGKSLIREMLKAPYSSSTSGEVSKKSEKWTFNHGAHPGLVSLGASLETHHRVRRGHRNETEDMHARDKTKGQFFRLASPFRATEVCSVVAVPRPACALRSCLPMSP